MTTATPVNKLAVSDKSISNFVMDKWFSVISSATSSDLGTFVPKSITPQPSSP